MKYFFYYQYLGFGANGYSLWTILMFVLCTWIWAEIEAELSYSWSQYYSVTFWLHSSSTWIRPTCCSALISAQIAVCNVTAPIMGMVYNSTTKVLYFLSFIKYTFRIKSNIYCWMVNLTLSCLPIYPVSSLTVFYHKMGYHNDLHTSLEVLKELQPNFTEMWLRHQAFIKR